MSRNTTFEDNSQLGLIRFLTMFEMTQDLISDCTYRLLSCCFNRVLHQCWHFTALAITTELLFYLTVMKKIFPGWYDCCKLSGKSWYALWKGTFLIVFNTSFWTFPVIQFCPVSWKQ